MAAAAQVVPRPEQIDVSTMWGGVVDVGAGGDAVRRQTITTERLFLQDLLAQSLPSRRPIPSADVDIRAPLIEPRGT
jgi:hypothetical protein